MLRTIVALLLVGHGIGHIMGFLAAWTTAPMGFLDRPWLLSPGIMLQSGIGKLFGLVWLMALAALVGAGIGLLARSEWWVSLAVLGSLLSLLAIVPWWNTDAAIPRIWASVVDVATLAVLLAPPWREALLNGVG